MKFSSPWMLTLAGLIPLIILLYILKQKREEQRVSSIMLWEQVLRDLEANTPWQKLKKNLLMLLQILAVAMAVLALADPFILKTDGGAEHIILVIDSSGSMMGDYNGKSRLHEAKELAAKKLESSPKGTKFTIISSSAQAKVLISKGEDKNQGLNAIKSITETAEFGDISDSLFLVRAMGNSSETLDYRAYIYTDTEIDLKGINGEMVSLANSKANVSLDFISHSSFGGEMTVLIRLTNHSSESLSQDLALYSDKEILDIKTVELSPAEVKTVYFEKIPVESPYIYGEWGGQDGLKEDNAIYHVVNEEKVKKIYLETEKNIFLEKALAIQANTEVYKGTGGKGRPEGYDLYVYDKVPPAEVSGPLLLIDQGGSPIDGGKIEVLEHPLTKYTSNLEAVVNKVYKVKPPYWADNLMTVNNTAAIYAGISEGRKIAYINFDLHDSDIVLAPEFPILLTNLTNWLMDQETYGKTSYLAGEPYYTKGVTPPKEGQIGIYTVEDEDKNLKLFAVNFPTEKESDLTTAIDSYENNLGAVGTGSSATFKTPLIILVLLIICIEWVVYIRGY